MEIEKDPRLAILKAANVDVNKILLTCIDNAYNNYIKDQERWKHEVVHTHDKYKVILKFVNKLMKNIGKAEVNELFDFKEISRDDILKQQNTDDSYKSIMMR